MNNLFYLTLFIFLSSPCLSQGKAQQTVAQSKLMTLDTSRMKALKLESDTFFVRSFTNVPSPTKPFMEQNGSWIAVLLIGLLAAWVNLRISSSTRKSSREALEKQLKNNQEALDRQLQANRDTFDKQVKNNQDVSEAQLNASRDIALRQIELAQNNALRDFNKTVLSGNRQAWINDLRTNMGKILNCAHYFYVGMGNDPDYKEMKYLVIHTELMLNPDDDKDFILSLNQLVDCSIKVMTKSKTPQELAVIIDRVKVYTQTTLKTEWKRVKRGE